MVDARPRCPWGTGDPLNLAYHDTEWGVPIHDDQHLFELLSLEGAQAGLAWITILRKRDGYRRAFEGWDPHRIAAYGPEDEARLLADPGIVRNRAKIRSVIALSRDLKERSFSFVGPTIVYAFMQSAGLVNDHLVSCFRHDEV
jgi:DNA-3-methyladenine glycosylase I